jgi:hypothetical protein
MSKRVDILFARFCAIYGHRWKSVFSDPIFVHAAKLEWSPVIDRMKDEDMEAGITLCKVIYDWPPSIAEFTKAALGIDEDAIKTACFPRGTGMLTYKQVDKKLAQERVRILYQLIEERLLPTQPLLEGPDDDGERRLGEVA